MCVCGAKITPSEGESASDALLLCAVKITTGSKLHVPPPPKPHACR